MLPGTGGANVRKTARYAGKDCGPLHWLGHESPETTHIYVEADLKTKEQALQTVAPAGKGFHRFRPGDALLAFLDAP
jgi:hypothetical protein